MVKNVSDFNIFLDTDNELAFSLEIDGAEDSSVKSQFIIEGPRGINLSFEGQTQSGEVLVEVPSLKGMVKEGVYDTRLEVIVDDRIFTPLEMRTSIKPSIKIEAAVKVSRKSNSPVVTASVLNSNKNRPVIESRKKKKTPTASKQIQKNTSKPKASKKIPELDSLLRELQSLS